jgi:N-acyl-D-amino-acid deacylase
MDRNLISRRRLLASAAGVGLGLAAAAGEASAAAAEPLPERKVGPYPVTGKGAAVLEPLDEAMVKVMLRHGIPGGAAAVARNGKLVLAKGYGWANIVSAEPARPDTLFGVASVSKVFTALAVFKLVEEKKLGLDDKPFEILKHLKPPKGAEPDARLAKVTVRQLLNHSGGWNRNVSGDPINWAQMVSQQLGVRMPITEEQLTRFVMGQPLDFDPGTNAEYSNFGIIVLGQVIAQVSGESYEEYVKESVLAPIGVKQAQLHDREQRYFPKEARRYMTGADQTLPPYNFPWTDASGGWTASVVDLVRILTALDGSRGKPFLSEALRDEMLSPPPAPLKPRENGSWFGLGWDTVQKLPTGVGYTKGGSWPGVRSMIKHRVDGFNTAFLFNALAEPDAVDTQIAGAALRDIQAAIEKQKEWPDLDLFNDYP